MFVVLDDLTKLVHLLDRTRLPPYRNFWARLRLLSLIGCNTRPRPTLTLWFPGRCAPAVLVWSAELYSAAWKGHTRVKPITSGLSLPSLLLNALRRALAFSGCHCLANDFQCFNWLDFQPLHLTLSLSSRMLDVHLLSRIHLTVESRLQSRELHAKDGGMWDNGTVLCSLADSVSYSWLLLQYMIIYIGLFRLYSGHRQFLCVSIQHGSETDYSIWDSKSW